MPQIPDRFDLWVRKARQEGSEERKLDLLLGSLYALSEWHFLNVGTRATPIPAMGEFEGANHILVFSNPGKIQDIVEEVKNVRNPAIPYLSVRAPDALAFCLQYHDKERGACYGILVNPGDYAFSVTFDALKKFDAEWKSAGAAKSRGFWIPNMTTEEEDFWQEKGID